MVSIPVQKTLQISLLIPLAKILKNGFPVWRLWALIYWYHFLIYCQFSLWKLDLFSYQQEWVRPPAALCHCLYSLCVIIDFPSGSAIKNLPVDAGDVGSVSGLGRSPGGEKCQASPVFLPEKSHGWRNLTGYSPWGSHRVRCDLATEHGHMHVPSWSTDLLYQGQPFLF